ncbi:hypothetical protein A6F55_24455 [Prescottella equi]|nr:hypothetical protein A6F55_24455 [Prescottella equi]ORL97891.1 hypothetical protein A5N72_23525 [Prescottella equi]
MPALLTRMSRWTIRAQRLDRRVVGHVQLDEVGAEPVGGLASVLGVPGSDPTRLARLDKSARDLGAEPLLPPVIIVVVTSCLSYA